MGCAVVVGGFFGDEGKGKVVAYLALRDRPSIVARGGVGPNAGHTVITASRTYGLRLVPSGFVYEKCRLLIGPGVALEPSILAQEVKLTGVHERLGVDYQCAIIEPEHIKMEMGSEHLAKTIGSTKSGVGACNAERALRKVRLAREIPELSRFLTDVPAEVNQALDKGEGVILEGTQGTFLSLYHGTYPYCTSKDTTAAAVCSDVGVGPVRVDQTIVVFKSFVTRVGEGPLVNELPKGEVARRGWLEYGTVTRRERRAAPFSLELAKRAVMLNRATQIALTKLDALFPEAKGAKGFEELSRDAKAFIQQIEAETGVPVTLISTGQDVLDMIDRRSEIKR